MEFVVVVVVGVWLVALIGARVIASVGVRVVGRIVMVVVRVIGIVTVCRIVSVGACCCCVAVRRMALTGRVLGGVMGVCVAASRVAVWSGVVVLCRLRVPGPVALLVASLLWVIRAVLRVIGGIHFFGGIVVVIELRFSG